MTNKWGTYDGRVVHFDSMEHQHMSNIYYWTTIVTPDYLYPQWLKNDIQSWLNIRFNGVILPYKPHIGWIDETNYLIRMNYLQNNDDIVVRGKVIGKYIYNQE